jgi:hypothetical protein
MMLPEGTKTCKLCGHVLWRDEEKEVCFDCKHAMSIEEAAKSALARFEAQNGEVSYKVWCENYPAIKALREALRPTTGAGVLDNPPVA